MRRGISSQQPTSQPTACNQGGQRRKARQALPAQRRLGAVPGSFIGVYLLRPWAGQRAGLLACRQRTTPAASRSAAISANVGMSVSGFPPSSAPIR